MRDPQEIQLKKRKKIEDTRCQPMASTHVCTHMHIYICTHMNMYTHMHPHMYNFLIKIFKMEKLS